MTGAIKDRAKSNGTNSIKNGSTTVTNKKQIHSMKENAEEKLSEDEAGPEKITEKKVSKNKQLKKTVEDDEESFGQISFKIDLIATLIFCVAAATRFYNLSYPHHIVFDELHYGKYASLYLRKIFFFDPHPPLGKQLVAASAYLFNPVYNGTFKFDRIGSPFPDWVPVLGMRFIPALAGSAVPSIAYLLCKELGISKLFAILAGILIIFDNALLIQSRHILMEMPLILFGIVSLIFALKSTKQLNYIKNWIFVSLSAFFGTLSMSVKYVGTFYLALSALIIFWRFWTRWVPRKDLSSKQVIMKLISYFGVFYLVFFATYVSIFYIHLNTLTNAGPHDAVMTSAFQASLKGGLASIIKGQPVQVAHGSQVTLRHSLGRACWLHSHTQNYPIKYADGRGSSHQQQVTCYSFKDVNNWWIIKRPDVENIAVNETKDVIKHGEEIHIVHGMTGRLLNSHDVAAPVTPQNQEVSCYIDHNVSMAAEPLWRVEIIGGCGAGDSESSEGCEWHAVRSMFRLIHVTTGQAMRMSGKQLPKWGYNQHEVVSDRVIVQDDTVWNVEEHRYTKSEKDREKELLQAEMIPTKPTVLTFWAKFLELQWKMLSSSGTAQSESHAYASFPSEWLFLSRGIAYWVGAGNNSQILLLGNPLIWLSASLGLFIHGGVLAFYLLRRRRLCFDIEEETWSALVLQSVVCLGGYLLTYIYHFCVDRTLFLHHYLPSYIFKLILFVATVHHIYVISRNWSGKYVVSLFLLAWVIGAVYVFTKFAPTSYGQPALSKAELESLKWMSSWDFIIQTHD